MTDFLPFYSERQMYSLQGGLCFYCSRQMTNFRWKDDNRKGYTRDHFFPKSMGNALTGNTVLACEKCNRKKSADFPTREEVLRFSELWSHFYRGSLIDLSEFHYTQSIINLLTTIVGIRVDTKTII